MIVRVVRSAILAVMALAGVGAAATAPLDALRLARGYLTLWHGTLESLVADEEYRQEVRRYIRGSSGGSRLFAPTIRRLNSEMLFLRAPAENLWLSFRDVVAVDGKAVTDRQKRFDALFAGPAALIQSTAERIALEGARYNLGRLPRTLNTPTAALVFLQPQYEANTRWKLETNKRLEGREVWELGFDQREPPFAVTSQPGVGHPSSGRFWIEPTTGRILQTEIVVRGRFLISRVRSIYGAVPSIQEGWVPLRMNDEYDAEALEKLNGVATYSNHRLFRTAGRILGGPAH